MSDSRDVHVISALAAVGCVCADMSEHAGQPQHGGHPLGSHSLTAERQDVAAPGLTAPGVTAPGVTAPGYSPVHQRSTNRFKPV
jgi:hypothetical protein